MIYAGKESGALHLIDVSHVIQDMLPLLKVLVSKHAALELDLGKHLPAIRANGAQIRQIMLNLVKNASDAIGDRDGGKCCITGYDDRSRVKRRFESVMRHQVECERPKPVHAGCGG
jgi:C4-dicarboxylate-specific signal transduction histidine kinase